MRLSDLVVVGQVIDVRTISYGARALPIAELRVDRVLKGPAETTRALFVAAGTWTCDITEAARGEAGLYFLHREEEDQSGKLGKAVQEAFGSRELLRVQWSGRGRMPLREVDGRSFATYWTEVEMPADLENIPGPETRYESFIRSAPLDELERRVTVLTERQAGPWLRFSVEAQPGKPALSWSIRGDGTCLFESRSGSSPIRTDISRLDDGVLLQLGIVFASQDRGVPFLPPVLDSSPCGGRQGTLEVLWGDELHVITIRAETFEPSPEDWRSYELLLDAWVKLYAPYAPANHGAPR